MTNIESGRLFLLFFSNYTFSNRAIHKTPTRKGNNYNKFALPPPDRNDGEVGDLRSCREGSFFNARIGYIEVIIEYTEDQLGQGTVPAMEHVQAGSARDDGSSLIGQWSQSSREKERRREKRRAEMSLALANDVVSRRVVRRSIVGRVKSY